MLVNAHFPDKIPKFRDSKLTLFSKTPLLVELQLYR